LTQREAVEKQIPRLAEREYRITSPEDASYNCFAWAANDNQRVWSPILLGSGVFWPPGVPARANLPGVVDAYEMTGFELCATPDVEPGFEKIAIFADSEGAPRHAARQLPSGGWTSKLGDHVDIEHNDLEAVGGDFYGEPAVFMRRSTETPPIAQLPRVMVHGSGFDAEVTRRLTEALQRRRSPSALLGPAETAADEEEPAANDEGSSDGV
jgi:hypothetical protein